MTNQHPTSPSPRYRWRWPALAALLVAEGMNLLDATVVQVAAPAIQNDLGTTDGQVQWLAAGYTLPFALLLIIGGRLGDVLGRKRVFITGTALFVICSALCAAAPNTAVLLGARALQGSGAALCIPQTFGLIRAMFDEAERARALGAIGPVMGLAAVCGPVAGGVLTDADVLGLGWRAVFSVNLPLGILVLAIAPLIREDRSPDEPRLDLTGTLLVSIALGLLIYPLVRGDGAGWAQPTWVCALAGLLVLAVFARQQVGRARRAASPLVEPGLFRDRGFPAALLSSLLFFAVMNGLMFVLVVFFQLGPGASPSDAGTAMLPWSIGLAAGSWFTGVVLVHRFGARTMRAGIGLLVAGLAGTALLLSAPVSPLGWWSVPPLLAAGFGIGMFTVPFFTAALSRVRDRETGSASGLLNSVQQLGATVGVALLGTLLFHQRDPVTGTQLALVAAIAMLVVVLALTFPLLRPKQPAAEGHARSVRSTSSRRML